MPSSSVQNSAYMPQTTVLLHIIASQATIRGQRKRRKMQISSQVMAKMVLLVLIVTLELVFLIRRRRSAIYWAVSNPFQEELLVPWTAPQPSIRICLVIEISLAARHEEEAISSNCIWSLSRTEGMINYQRRGMMSARRRHCSTSWSWPSRATRRCAKGNWEICSGWCTSRNSRRGLKNLRYRVDSRIIEVWRVGQNGQLPMGRQRQ